MSSTYKNGVLVSAANSTAQININISYELIEYMVQNFCVRDMHVESVTCLEQLNPSCNMHVKIAITCMLHKPSCYMSVTCV